MIFVMFMLNRNNFEETFNVLENLYNIADMERGVLTKILNQVFSRLWGRALFGTFLAEKLKIK